MSRTVVAALNALQQLDLEIDRSASEVDVIKHALNEDAAGAAREAAARAREAAERARRRAQDAEQAVQDAESRIRQQEGRLYGGGTAMRDLSALETMLVHLREAHARQEEGALALMLAADEAEAAAEAAAHTYRAAEQDWKRRQRDLQARLAQLEMALTDLRARRREQAAAIDSSALQRYEALRPAHRGRGVALVENGICQHCRISLTPAAVHRARASAELVTCGNCGCILYAP